MVGVAHLRDRAGRPVPARVARRVVRPTDTGRGARKHHPLHPTDRLRAGLRSVRRVHGCSDIPFSSIVTFQKLRLQLKFDLDISNPRLNVALSKLI